MKKFTIIFIMLLAFAGISRAQVIENFEPAITMGLFNGGTTGMVGTVANPDQTGINTSLGCGMMVRAKDGDAWQGWASNIPVAIDADANKYVHVKIWKPRVTKVVFKYETLGGLGSNSGDVTPITAQVDSNKWEELVFNMGAVAAVSGMQYRIVLIPDFPAVVGLTTDINIYFDDIYVNNDPAVGSPAVQLIVDYEYIPLHLLLADPPAADSSKMKLVLNPDKTGQNPSGTCIEFDRDKDGVVWGGFWSPTHIDLTVNKFVHVKVWKPRISPVVFHLEGGSAGNGEFESKYPQTVLNGWQDMVWDFRGKSGVFTVIGLQPDKAALDPNDITMYFDDIVVNNDSTPTPPIVQVLNVDMHGSKLAAGQGVYFSGNFGGAYGSWATPGSLPTMEMLDADGDSIYTTTILVPNGSYELKFFKGANWNNGDPVTGNRFLGVNGSFNITYKWNVLAPKLTLNVDMKGSGIKLGEIVYFAGNFGGTYGSWVEPGKNSANILTGPDADSIYTAVLYLGQPGTFAFKFFKGPTGWAGGEWTGDPNRELVVPAADLVANYAWGKLGQIGISENPLANKVGAYPVPFSNTLTINTQVDVKSIVIVTAYGQQVARFDNVVAGRNTISTSNLANGMYFITFYGKNGGQITQKLMKN
jgi:hypothetical protein